MYNLVVLPTVKYETINIRDYIINELCDFTAARNLMREIKRAFMQIRDNPQIGMRHFPEKELSYEYRKKIVNRSYILFYWIDEKKKIITVTHIFNTRMNYKVKLF